MNFFVFPNKPVVISLFLPLVASLILTFLVEPSKSCNEAVCASIVSKCTLLKSCECEIQSDQPCSCCDRCTKCLSYLMPECCSCFGLCRKPNITEMAEESIVFDFPEPVPSLWVALTQNDNDDRWDLFTYPVDLHPTEVKYNSEGKERQATTFAVNDEQQQNSILVEQEDIITVNCTVAFLRQCTPKHKCKVSCSTMGASYGRWFEDGCCQCVGHNCRDYGINESRCSECVDEDLDEKSDDELEELEKQLEDELYDDDDVELQQADQADT